MNHYEIIWKLLSLEQNNGMFNLRNLLQKSHCRFKFVTLNNSKSIMARDMHWVMVLVSYSPKPITLQ